MNMKYQFFTELFLNHFLLLFSSIHQTKKNVYFDYILLYSISQE